MKKSSLIAIFSLQLLISSCSPASSLDSLSESGKNTSEEEISTISVDEHMEQALNDAYARILSNCSGYSINEDGFDGIKEFVKTHKSNKTVTVYANNVFCSQEDTYNSLYNINDDYFSEETTKSDDMTFLYGGNYVIKYTNRFTNRELDEFECHPFDSLDLALENYKKTCFSPIQSIVSIAPFSSYRVNVQNDVYKLFYEAKEINSKEAYERTLIDEKTKKIIIDYKDSLITQITYIESTLSNYATYSQYFDDLVEKYRLETIIKLSYDNIIDSQALIDLTEGVDPNCSIVANSTLSPYSYGFINSNGEGRGQAYYLYDLYSVKRKINKLNDCHFVHEINVPTNENYDTVFFEFTLDSSAIRIRPNTPLYQYYTNQLHVDSPMKDDNNNAIEPVDAGGNNRYNLPMDKYSKIIMEYDLVSSNTDVTINNLVLNAVSN